MAPSISRKLKEIGSSRQEPVSIHCAPEQQETALTPPETLSRPQPSCLFFSKKTVPWQVMFFLFKKTSYDFIPMNYEYEPSWFFYGGMMTRFWLQDVPDCFQACAWKKKYGRENELRTGAPRYRNGNHKVSIYIYICILYICIYIYIYICMWCFVLARGFPTRPVAGLCSRCLPFHRK